MNDLFLKAIKSQDKLDNLYPCRNWPTNAQGRPEDHVIKSITLYRKGLSVSKIAKELKVSVNSVRCAVRRSHIYRYITPKNNFL
tara:strand:+ start:6532 stop:6783 length:252 start_codon:yes stop_codon:yes gene_type:complete